MSAWWSACRISAPGRRGETVFDEPGVGFAFLVAEEAIDLALRRRETNEVYFDGCLKSDDLDVAKRLATELAAAQPRFQPAREILARLDAARAACAPSHTARAAAESAHDHHERILFRGSPETKIDQLPSPGEVRGTFSEWLLGVGKAAG